MKRGREMAKRLDSAVAVRNVKTPGRHPAGETLYLMVWPSARKSWVQRLTIEGKRKDLGLGPYPAVSLAQARKSGRRTTSPRRSPAATRSRRSRRRRSFRPSPPLRPWPGSTLPRTSHSWRNAKHRSAVELNPCDLCIPDAGRPASERDHPPARGGCALPHLDLQAGDRTAGAAAHPRRHGPGGSVGAHRLQPGRRRHQRCARQAASRQEPPPRLALR